MFFMKTPQFIELPTIYWNGYAHREQEQLINMNEVLQIVPNGRHEQTKIVFKNGKEEFVNRYYADVMKLIELQCD